MKKQKHDIFQKPQVKNSAERSSGKKGFSNTGDTKTSQGR